MQDAKVTLEYLSLGDESVERPRSACLSLMYMVQTLLMSWVVTVFAMAIFMPPMHYGATGMYRWTGAVALGIGISAPQYLIVRWAIYDRCYTNPWLFAQALLLSINHGFALSAGVLMLGAGPCGC